MDTIIVVEEPSSDAAVTRLEAGDIDVYAYNISEPDIAQRGGPVVWDQRRVAHHGEGWDADVAVLGDLRGAGQSGFVEG